MAYPPSVTKTYIAGEVLDASELNQTQQDWIDSNIPEDIDDYSNTTGEQQTTSDMDLDGSGNAPTSLSEEVEGIRDQIDDIKGPDFSQWYNKIANQTLANATMSTLAKLMSYRRPNLEFVSVTEVDVENNTGTSNETRIIFPDGDVREVTEDTSSNDQYRRFVITDTAEFSSGIENSGMRSGESESNNTWYAIYAVKSSIDSSKFVLVGTTTFPTQGNVSTLNTNLNGANSWVYLGAIRNGDSDSAAGDILKFVQSNGITLFKNVVTSVGSQTISGILLSEATNTTAVTYSHSSGTGDTDIPPTIVHAYWNCAFSDSDGSAQSITIGDSAFSFRYVRDSYGASESEVFSFFGDAAAGVKMDVDGGGTPDYGICLKGFVDKALGSPMPLI